MTLLFLCYPPNFIRFTDTIYTRFLEFTSCPASDFRCLNAWPVTCIPEHKKCDGRLDCPDGSDEAYNFAGCRQGPCEWGDGLYGKWARWTVGAISVIICVWC